MAVKSFSKKAKGDFQIGKYFKVKEFACKDGSDTVLVDTITVGYLDKIREHFKKPVIVTSGYRTSSYNKKVGGATNSFHVKGQACDIHIDGVAPEKIAQYAESLGIKRIGLYAYGGTNGFVHIDSHTTKYYWKQTSKNGSSFAVSTFGGTASKPSGTTGSFTVSRVLKKKIILMKGDDVKALQNALIKAGYAVGKGGVDGKYGKDTEAAVRAFQKAKNLLVDGKAGKQTITALGGVWKG